MSRQAARRGQNQQERLARTNDAPVEKWVMHNEHGDDVAERNYRIVRRVVAFELVRIDH